MRKLPLLMALLGTAHASSTVSPALPALEVQGHRGTRALRPENTIPAFEYALKVGVDVLEMDMAVTKDKVLVISHDPHVNPAICLGPEGKALSDTGPLIHSLTLKELKAYDCGTLKNPRFPKQVPVPGTRIPTLAEVFEFVRKSKLPAARRVGFNIETKIFPENPELTVGPEEFAELAFKEFKKSGFLSRIVLQSFDPRTLVAAKRLDPKLKLSMLIDEGSQLNLLSATQKAGAGIVSPHFKLLNAATVKELHEAGLKVIPWTLNEPAEWDAARDFGVDGIISDDPEALIAHLKKKP